ncbi:hypothetical protein FJ365_00815 [Candidatus Dependentiae bacterium]|nr:hypothetical protein [Candidatus Dependentiae bacterium]
MYKIRFISAHLWLLLILGTVFIKIYQYNLYIKTSYEHQRLGRCFALLEKERNELLVCLYEQQQPITLMMEAEQKGMQPIGLEGIITTTNVAVVDFVGTTSTTAVLAQCGIPVTLPAQPGYKNSLSSSISPRYLKEVKKPKRERQARSSMRKETDLAMIADRLSQLDTSLMGHPIQLAVDEQPSFDAWVSLSNVIIEKV